jgi:signal peptidase I
MSFLRKAVPALALVAATGAVIAGIVALEPRFERMRVPSETMAPTIPIGTTVNVSHSEYDDDPPAVGHVVIHHPPVGAEIGNECGAPPRDGQVCAKPTPERSDVLFIKRVVAGPGDRLAVRDGRVILDGSPRDEPFVDACDDELMCNLPREITIPPDHYFLMGDNRDASDDSRFWGPVPREWIAARVYRCSLVYIGCSAVD